MSKAKKEKILSKVRKQKGVQICISGDLIPEEINLTTSEYQEVLHGIYREEAKNTFPNLEEQGYNDLIIDHLSNQMVTSGMGIGDFNKDTNELLDVTTYYPFLDKDHGLILAKAEAIQKAIISNIDYSKPIGSRLFAFLNHLNPDFGIDLTQSELIEKNSKNRIEALSKEKYQLLKKYSIDELKQLLEQPIAEKSKIEDRISPFTRTDNEYWKEVILADFLFRLNMFVFQMKLGEHCNSRRLYHINKLVREIQSVVCNSLVWFLPQCSKLLEDYLQILKQTIDAKSINPIKNQHSKFIKLYEKQMSLNESICEMHSYYEDDCQLLYPGLSKSSITKIDDLQKLEDLIASNPSSISDYSLLTFGYISVLEKELNDIVELLRGEKSNSSLFQIFKYFGELDDYSKLDSIYPV